MRGLHFLTKCSDDRRLLASWHSPHSLTWRWVVDVSFGGRLKPMFWYDRHNSGGNWSIRCLGVSLNWRWQRPVWYRELYMRLRDEKDQLTGMLWLHDDHPNKVHRNA